MKIETKKPLKITQYIGKKGRYNIAYFEGKFRFVHICKEIEEYIEQKYEFYTDKKGNKYVLYDGVFIIGKDGNIYIGK